MNVKQAPAQQGLTPTTLAQQGRIQGFGNTPVHAQPSVSSSRDGSFRAPTGTSGTTQGFGNTSFTQGDPSISGILAAELADAYRVTGLADFVQGVSSKIYGPGQGGPPGAMAGNAVSSTGPARGYNAVSSSGSGGPRGYGGASVGSGEAPHI